MLVPSCFHGLIKDVKRESAKIARKLLAGKSLEEAVSAYGMLDTRDFPGSVFQLRYSHQCLCRPDDFHFPYLAIKIYDFLYKKYDYDYNVIDMEWQRMIPSFWEADWSTLCLCDTGSNLYENPPLFHDEKTFDKRTRWFPYLRAVLRHWDAYVEMGDAFDSSPYERHTIWEKNRVLHCILVNLGIPAEVLRQPLPGMNLKKLLDDYGVFDVDISQLPWC